MSQNTYQIHDIQNWIETNKESFPNLIINEFIGAIELANNNQPHGAFFQVKDTFEVLIKCLTLLVAEEILHNNEPDSNKFDLIFSFFEKPLSLGDWLRICTYLNGKSSYSELNTLMNSVLKMFNSNQITKWRNDYIGHGASQLADDQVFIRDISQKISLLYDFFRKEIDNFACFSLTLMENSISLNYKSNICFDLNDMFLLEDSKIYIFDSFNSKYNRSTYLNYSFGYKKTYDNERITNLVNQLIFDKKTRVFKSDLDSQIFKVAEDELINKINKIDDYVNPEFITNHLKSFINENDSGTLLLQMERGVGKSTIAHAFDQHGMNKCKLKNCVVRSYYINDSYKSSKSNFAAEINDMFRVDKDGKLLFRGKMPYLDENSSSRDFIDLLAYYRNMYFEFEGKDKLILFIDGLDEIQAQNNGSLFDFLPQDGVVSDDILIIYTSRTDSELESTFFNMNEVGKMKFSEVFVVDNNSQAYIDTLFKYMAKKVKNLSAQEQLELINKSTHSFRHTKRISNTLSLNYEIGYDEILSDKYFNEELEQIEMKFGGKVYCEILTILLYLTLIHEPVRLEVISRILGNARLTFDFIYKVLQIRDLLVIVRTATGDKVTIEDTDFRSYLSSTFGDEIKEISNNLITSVIAETNSKDDSKLTIDSVYTLTKINRLISVMGEPATNYIDRELFIKFLRIEENLNRNIHSNLELINGIQNQLIELLTKDIVDMSEEKVFYIILTSNQAEVADLLGFTTKSVEIFSRSVEKLNELDLEDYPYGIYYTNRTYIKFALLCIKIGEFSLAIQNLNNALELLESKAFSLVRIPTTKDYIYIYNNRGIAHQYNNNTTKAEEDYNKAISLYEKDTINDEGLKYDLSMLYLNRATINNQKGKTYVERVSSDLNKAENLISEDVQYDEHRARILLNKSIMYVTKDDFENALTCISKSVEYLESLLSSDIRIDEDAIMKAYNNKGVILQKTGDDEGAIKCYDDMIRLIDINLRDGKYVDVSEFIKAVINLGSLYRKKKLYTQAINTYEKIICSDLQLTNGISSKLISLTLSYFQVSMEFNDNIDVKCIVDWLIRAFNYLEVCIDYDDLDILFVTIIALFEDKSIRTNIVNANDLLLRFISFLKDYEFSSLNSSYTYCDLGDQFLIINKYGEAFECYNIFELEINNHDIPSELKVKAAKMYFNRSILNIMNKDLTSAYSDSVRAVELTEECLSIGINIEPEFVVQRKQQLRRLHIKLGY